MKNRSPKNRRYLNYLNSHSRPTTRREFIARGLMAGGGFALAPTLGSLLYAESATAAGPSSSQIPFLVFDLVGGAALPGNFLAGGKGGALDLLKSYDMLGWNPTKTALDERFGLPMAGDGVSKMLEGMLTVLSPEAQKNLRFASLCHIAQTDSPTNPMSALSLAMRAGCKGTVLEGSCGLLPTASGGFTPLALDGPSYRPFFVSNLESLQAATDLGGRLRQFSTPLKIRFSDFIRDLSNASVRSGAGASFSIDQLRQIDERYGKVKTLLQTKIEIDPRAEADLAALYGVNAGTSSSDQAVLRAALVQGAVSGQTGPAAISIDGCDYHDGTQQSGDEKDLEVGIEIGRAVEFAYRMQKPLFFQVLTDGGIYASDGNRMWIGDRVESCMTIMGYFNPTAEPKYRVEGSRSVTQIGNYTDGQGAERGTVIGESPMLTAYAVAANYLSIQGRLNEFATLFPSTIAAADLDSVVAFA